MEDKLTKCLTGFRKSYGTLHSLLTMLEERRRDIDNGAYISALLWTFQRPSIQ